MTQLKTLRRWNTFCGKKWLNKSFAVGGDLLCQEQDEFQT